ncbi:RNA polymerase sigma factor [Syntrophomonas palmitatica]|uniref:RNA polymerase sigma factor n=1 Tax=Syntrophomonas palmitatica TaxID=402877 RepID=UPI0006D2C5E2|nr:sigma-70 family RNA polymerase sigma factor [Syntrophomonas palmitatica]
MGRLNQDQALEFYNQEYPALYRYALYLCSQRETAEEICQETFLRWFRLDNQGEIEYPRAWLKKVAGRLAINYGRRHTLIASHEILQDPETISRENNTEQQIERLEVEDILSRLSWRDQILLKMKMAGESYQSIAEALDIAPGSVGTLLARAMTKFREEYMGKEGEHNHEMSGRRKTSTISGT